MHARHVSSKLLRSMCRQVHPGLVKSNFMERAEFYGKDSVEERKSFRQLVRLLV